MAFPTVSVLDNFNRSNGAIGGNWASGFTDPAPAVNSNVARGAASGWYGAVYAPSGTPASYSAPQEAFYTIPSLSSGTQQLAGIVARGTDLNSGTYTGYLARVVNADSLQIGKYVSSAFTPLTTSTFATLGITPAAGDKIGIEVIGTSSPVTIRLYYAPAGVWPGTPTLTFSDSSSPILSGGQVGVSFNQGSANTGGMDDFGAGATVSGTPPSNSVAPAVTGSATVGEVLSCSTGTWSGDATISFGYQWQADTAGNGTFSNISGATSSTYTLQAAEEGDKVRCVVTGTNGSGSASANSNQAGPVAAASSGADPNCYLMTGSGLVACVSRVKTASGLFPPVG
jgi:hypothetical protein